MQETPCSFEQKPQQSQSSVFEWKGVSFTVTSKETPKQILHSQDGEASSGRLTAIMGASGAGKTSLLNALAGRVPAQFAIGSTGKFILNSTSLSKSQLRASIAFVEQQDTLMATDTTREALRFSAYLRCHKSDRKEERVEEALSQLRLQKCSDTRIGDLRLKGISGGEKKRASIGVELLSDPAIVLLDEPTSGLDSHTALSVVKTMRDLSRQGKIVIATIHQPSSEIFHLFDDLLLLSEGKVIYSGPVAGAHAHFASCGHPVPANYNPSDHYLSVMSTVPATELLSKDAGAIQKLVMVSDISHDTSATIEENLVRERAPLFTQLKFLMSREFKRYMRDPSFVVAGTLANCFIAIILGIFNMNAGRMPLEDEFGAMDKENVNNACGALFLPVISSFMAGLGATMVKTIPLRPIFTREYISGTYSITAYILAMTLVFIPVSLVQMGLFAGILQAFIGYRSNFALFYFTIWILNQAGTAWGVFIAMATGSIDISSQLSPVIIVPQIYIAGFYRSINAIPAAVRWLQWICALKYGYMAILISEFNGSKPELLKEMDFIFDANGLPNTALIGESLPSEYAFYLLMIVAICVGLRVMAATSLWISVKK